MPSEPVAMRLFISFSISVLLAVNSMGQPSDPEIRVLIVDGFSNHNWQQTTKLTRMILEETGMFSVSVSTTPSAPDDPLWESWDPGFEHYDVVIQNCNNIREKEMRWPQKTEKELEDYVAGGGGLYILHSANNSFAHWQEYDRMIGLGWRDKDAGIALEITDEGKVVRIPTGEGGNTSHGARFEALIRVLTPHAINRGYPESWRTPGMELYLFPRGAAEDITVLSFAKDPAAGRNWPVEWLVQYGKGWVYNSSLGHLWKGETYPDSYRCVGFQTTLIRTVEWLARGKVSYAVPDNFPSPDAVSLAALPYGNGLKESGFSLSLKAGQRILEEPAWTNWDMAPMYDEKGLLHLFVGRWPHDGNWHENAQIVHYTAPCPEGPYTFVDTVFSDDTISYFNPQISGVDGRYIMVYSYKEKSMHNLNQQVGLATSGSLAGPWHPSPFNPVLAPSFEEGSANSLHASNPTFLKDPGGKYRIYYKSISDKPVPYLRSISLAVAEVPEGPYTNHPDNPVLSYVEHGLDIEDPYIFFYQGKYQLIVEDRMDVASVHRGDPVNPDTVRLGGWRPGLIYESEDGIHWGEPQIAYRTNSHYFKEEVNRFERPHILWKEEKPEYLFLSLARGKYGTGTGVVLKIIKRN